MSCFVATWAPTGAPQEQIYFRAPSLHAAEEACQRGLGVYFRSVREYDANRDAKETFMGWSEFCTRFAVFD